MSEQKHTPKDVVINMRIRPSHLRLIDSAARALGISRSQFIRQCAEAEARAALKLAGEP